MNGTEIMDSMLKTAEKVASVDLEQAGKKMVGIARFDKERSDEEREQRRPEVEQRKATHIKNHRPAAPGGRTNIENKKNRIQNLFVNAIF